MSITKPVPSKQVCMLELPAIAALLVREQGLHKGHYEVSLGFAVSIANFKADVAGQPGPTGPGMLGVITGIGLTESSPSSPLSVDAALVNPAPVKPRATMSKPVSSKRKL